MSILIGQQLDDHYDFHSLAVMPDNTINEDFHFSQYIKGKVGVLFFYTMNFSYICPTELKALTNKYQEFKKFNAEVVAISCDSHLSHLKWKQTPTEYGGAGDLPFPLASDITHRIADAYGVTVNHAMPLRAVYVLDQAGCFRFQAVYDLPLGRNIDEILRVVQGMNHYQKTGNLLPANWSFGKEDLPSNEESLVDFMSRNAARL